MSNIRNVSGSAKTKRNRTIKLAPMTRAVRSALTVSAMALALGASGGAFAAGHKVPQAQVLQVERTTLDFAPVHDLATVAPPIWMEVPPELHPTLIDVVCLISLLPNADCVVKRAVACNPFMRGPVRAAGYISNDDGAGLVEDCIAAVRAGGSLVIFPEGTRSVPGKPLRLQRGAANIAVRGELDVTPVHIRCSPETLGKGQKWYRVPPRRFHVRIEVGEAIQIHPFLVDTPTSKGDALAARRLTDHLTHYFDLAGDPNRAGT